MNLLRKMNKSFKKLMISFIPEWKFKENLPKCRHGPGHKTSPTAVNYRANIEALHLAGCTHVLASTACGSLQESICRGQLIIPDSFLDRTIKRNITFYDGTSSKYFGKLYFNVVLI